jgi:spoIIIJ-associated protein
MSSSVEKTGKTVEDAVQAALAELGVTRDQVDVEVLEASKDALFGLIKRDARVRVTIKEEAPEIPEETPVGSAAGTMETTPEETAENAGDTQEKTVSEADEEAERQAVANQAKAFLENLFKAMGMNLIIEKFINRGEGEIELKLHGDGLGVLIGKHGQTLDSLQYLTNLAANKDHKQWHRVVLDAENYRKRRRETLEKLAHNLAQRVKRSGRKAMLEPMNPYERKIVHVSLQNDPDVVTYSEGEEPYRKVIIDLK